jgi:hypothetical protein
MTISSRQIQKSWLIKLYMPMARRMAGRYAGVVEPYDDLGFDPKTRTSHSMFALDLSSLNGSEQRQAVLNWSEQVRRNARRLREQHVAAREVHRALTEQLRAQRDELRREAERDRESGPRSDDR